MPDWLQEFKEGLIDSVPEHRESSSHPSRTIKIWSREQKWWYRVNKIFDSVPERPELKNMSEDENNVVFLQKTHLYSRAQNGKFRNLITAEQKVFGEGCESQHSHRYAVVVQDLATQWIQSYPCKTNFSGNAKILHRLEPTRKPKGMYTDKSLQIQIIVDSGVGRGG